MDVTTQNASRFLDAHGYWGLHALDALGLTRWQVADARRFVESVVNDRALDAILADHEDRGDGYDGYLTEPDWRGEGNHETPSA
jgi:hypothetical protein